MGKKSAPAIPPPPPLPELKPIQVIAPTQTLTPTTVNLQTLFEAEREVEVHRLVNEEAHRPFDLAQGPLFRATLLRLDEEQYVLLLSMHHIISDCWSIGVLLQELFQAGRLLLELFRNRGFHWLCRGFASSL